MASPTITLTPAELTSIIASAVDQALEKHDRKRSREEKDKKDKEEAGAERFIIEVEDDEEVELVEKRQKQAEPGETAQTVAPEATPVQPVVNKQACVICLDGDAQVKFRGCKHGVVCCECFIDKDGKARFASCPVCRVKVVNIKELPPFTVDGLVYDHVMSERGTRHNEELVRAMEFIVKGSTGAIKLCRKAMEYYSESAGSSGFPMLSVDQAEGLITAAEKRVGHDQFIYYVHHLFVCMCVHPWNVDSKIGQSGLCYYGNFGGKPFIQEGIGQVLGNRSILVRCSLSLPDERSSSIAID